MQEFSDFVSHITSLNMFGRIIVAVVIVIVVAIVCHFLVKAIQRLLSIEQGSISQSTIVVNIVRIVVWGIAICFIADVCFGINMTALIAALGVGGIAISLGFQNTLSNLFGGLQITMTRVIKPGDNVRVAKNEGVVQDISWSYTTICNADNETIIVPNAIMSSNAVTHLLPPEHIAVPIVVKASLENLNQLTQDIEKAALEAACEYAQVTKNPTVSFSRVTEEGLCGSIVLEISEGAKAKHVCDAVTRAVAPLIQG